MSIPRVLHVVWIGDETQRPEDCIQSWARLNPGFELKVWGNREMTQTQWINARHMEAMWSHELAGVADLMRWEILHRHGGFAIDADGSALRPLDDWLFDCTMFACWENELARPGLIANGYVASAPGNPLVARIIDDLRREADLTDRMAWQSTGPLRLTQAFHRHRCGDLSIYPSHYFMPEHFTGVCYAGSGRVYARQQWRSAQRHLAARTAPGLS
ncbi:MAG: hypothetical protein KF834_00070 [Burkholderiales bacterium]|nr:hypothetical protein [Burkholderiales bacterium]